MERNQTSAAQSFSDHLLTSMNLAFLQSILDASMSTGL